MAENNIESRIQLSRGEYIEDSRAIAILRLNEREFLEGEVAIINYYKNADFRTDIGTLVAIGVSEGKGESHYRILSTGDSVLVRNVVDELPDVSSLVHNELYIYKDPDDIWYYVYKNSNEPERTIEPITGGPFIFIDAESGYRWFYRDQVCQREDDFLSVSKIKEIFQKIILNDGYLEVTSLNGYLFELGKVKDIHLQLEVWNRAHTEDISDQCTYYINDEQIFPNSDGTYTYNSVSKDTTLLVEARVYLLNDLYLTFSRQVDIYFGHKFYFGTVNEDWEPENKESITSLGNVRLSRKIDFDWNEINLNLQKTVFCYPKRYGYLEHIYDDNGLDYIKDYRVYSGISIDSLQYLIYVKTSAVSISNFRQIYSFEPFALVDKEVDLTNVSDIDGENILNIVKAWRNRNMANGMLLLDEEGKIPSSIVSGDDILGQAIVIADEKEFYPVSGMTKGCVYYITSTKKLYHALKEDSGEILIPDENKIYIYNKDLTVRRWNPETGEFDYENSLTFERIYDISELIS